ncbi:rRNA processing WD-repeat protein, putative [Plasmodium sp. gorilla clade G2]|uniref:rRNA processing WD-repeat protein, putative n=1 Tax=Plasmodium sp. gorilla clade G2 TaxID=880535 RepID=UPI000D201DCF|nr:rRNA processing WD-repeat protein, putative [Plasmodium sp. gorilla clade G2]SOV13379.1 rRNA processing WD-repeat protein, putative [Plasmodium sp. gorilla clade G2]
MLNYTLSNICGCFYTGGKILFSNDGNCLFVPVSNRINIYDLCSNSCNTLKSESRNDIRHIAIHPSMEIIITVDKFGYGCVINLLKDQIISRILFKSKTGVVTSFNYNNMLTPQEEQDVVNSSIFTNNGKYFLISIGRRVIIWKSPCKKNNYKLIKYNDICFHSLNVISLDISTDDKYFLTTSYDMTIRIHTVKKEKKIKPTILSGNKTTIVGAFFSKDGNFIFSVNKSGLIIMWSYEAQTDEGQKYENFEANKVYEDINSDNINSDDKKSDDDINSDDKKSDDDINSDDDERNSCDDENVSFKNEKKKNRKEEKSSKIYPYNNKIKDNNNNNNNNNNNSVKRAFEKRWCYKKIYYCNQEKNEEVIRSCFNKEKDIFVIAFSSGRFAIYSTPDMTSLYNISINTNTIDDITINTDGEWIALGEGNNGTIIIWEWKSESYILKQNTTNKNVKCVKFSPIISHLKIGSHIIDNSSTYHESDNFTSKFVIVTGNEDGTIKLYDYLSFINFVTFTAHTNSVTDICFLPQGNAFISCSLDGTVRAFDLLRYRNFKIYTPDVITESNQYSNNMNDLNSSGKKKVDKKLNVQFLCVSVNISGNIVAAGGRGNEYLVYIWNVQTGKCIDKLYGHNSPIIKICFSTNLKNEGIIASCSWSKNVLIWDLYARQNKGSKYEEITTSHDISYMCFDPRGNDILAVCTLSCKIIFWDISIQEVIGTIEGARDIKRGRLLGEQFGAIPKMNKKRNRKKSLNNLDDESMYEEDLEDQGKNTIVNQNCYFTSIDYIHNGNYIVGCANCSVSLYIYDTYLYLLIKIIDLTKNYCVDGIKREISTRYLTSEGTHIYELDISDEEGDIYLDNYKIMNRKKKQNLLPGQMNEDYLNSKLKKYKFLLNQLHISGDDRHIAVACNTGLYVFTKDYQYQYIPSIKNIYKGLISPNIYVPKFLTQNVNLKNLKNSLKKKEYMKAFILSLALNNYEHILEVYENIPYNIIPLCVKVLTKPFLFILINFIKTLLINDTIKHIHLHLFYLNSIFTTHFNVFLNNDFYNHMHNNKSIKNSQDKNKTSTPNIMSNTTSLFSSDEIRTSLLLILKQIFTINNGLQYLYTNNINVLKYLSLKE